jgi:hypothetical protein
VIARLTAESPGVVVQFPVVGIPGQGKMLVALLREFAHRTATDHRGNPEAARPQLHMINALARQLLARRWAGGGGGGLNIALPPAPPNFLRAGQVGLPQRQAKEGRP